MPDWYVDDARRWLDARDDVGAIVSSLPDSAETRQSLDDWVPWFRDMVGLLVAKASATAPIILYQTDRKIAGRCFSKAALVIGAAEAAGARVLWHKIVLRREPGAIDIHRPGFSHLIAFSREGRPGHATADVIRVSRAVYKDGIGEWAAMVAINAARLASDRLVDPFCGRGIIPILGEVRGMKTAGIDIDPGQIAIARKLKIRL